MEIAARGGDGCMAEGDLHEVDGRTPIEAVARVRMAQPVRRDLSREPGPLSRGFHHAVHGALVQGTPALAGAEHRCIGSGFPAKSS